MTELEQKKKRVDYVQNQKPTYTDSYAQKVNTAADAISNRLAFTYNPESDSTYQSYRNQYVRQGQQAMRDSMAQAAGLTGGYGSTYAQRAGQQSYDSYLQKLNDMLPELYNSARAAYDKDGDNLYQQYKMLVEAQGAERDKYNADYSKWQSELAAAKADEEALYSRQKKEKDDAYKRLADAIAKTGYMPDTATLEAAGMTLQEAAAWFEMWYKENGPRTRSGSGNSNTTPTGMTYEEARKLADSKWNQFN